MIEDPSQIRSITEFVDNERHGWGGYNDMFGVPVPDIIANFYDGKEFKGHFGAGPSDFETQREGGFSSKPSSKEETQTFLRLVGLPNGVPSESAATQPAK